MQSKKTAGIDPVTHSFYIIKCISNEMNFADFVNSWQIHFTFEKCIQFKMKDAEPKRACKQDNINYLFYKISIYTVEYPLSLQKPP